MGKKLIESNFNVSKIYTMRESAFDNSPFRYDEKENLDDKQKQLDLLNQSGLIDYKNAAALPNDIVDTIKEFIDRGESLIEAPPVPLEIYPDSFSPTFFNEKPSYLRMFINENNVEFYPLCNNLCKVDSLGNYLVSNVGRPNYVKDSIQKIDELLSRDINVFQRGASPSNSKNNNLLFYPNEKSCWADCWPGSVSLNNSLFISYDTFEVGTENKNSFITSLELKSNTIYCGSFFARFYDGSPNIANIDERLKEETLEDILKVEIGDIEVTLLGGSDEKVSTSWKRLFYVFKTPAPEILSTESNNLNCKLKISLNLKSQENLPIPLRISGLLIEEQDYPSPYNSKSISYESNSLNNDPTIYSPLAINSDLLAKNKPWTLMYKKFVEGVDSNDNFSNDNSFSDIICGKEIKNECLNDEQIIFITHGVNNLEIEVKIYSSDGSLLSSKSITFKENDNFYSEENNIKYNILLGSKSLWCNTYYGYYKDLLIVPEVLEDNDEDNDIKEILNTFFDVSIKYTDTSGDSKYEFSRDGYVIPDLKESYTEISFENLINISQCIAGSKYKLTSPNDKLRYDVGDILVCIKDFNRRLSDFEISSYWSRTPKKDPKETAGEVIDASIFRAGNLVEGYIK